MIISSATTATTTATQWLQLNLHTHCTTIMQHDTRLPITTLIDRHTVDDVTIRPRCDQRLTHPQRSTHRHERRAMHTVQLSIPHCSPI